MTIFVMLGSTIKIPLEIIAVNRMILIKREYVESILLISRMPGEPVVCERTLSANASKSSLADCPSGR
jgi:hypothetical protein